MAVGGGAHDVRFLWQALKIGLRKLIIHLWPTSAVSPVTQEYKMAKGQQGQKMVKKPKKDTAPPKAVSPDAVRPTVTTVVPIRGKLKNAPTR